MKDLEPLNFFLGIEVITFSSGLFLSMHKYVCDSLSKASMTDYNYVGTPRSQKLKLHNANDSLVDTIYYHSAWGYLTSIDQTRSQACYA